MIYGLSGPIGSGKSFHQLKFGLESANRKHKFLVTNFLINRKELYRYCLMPKLLDWPFNVGAIIYELIKIPFVLLYLFGLRKSHRPPLKPRHPWIIKLILKGEGIICLPNLEDLEELTGYPNSVALLDEAGIFLNSRQFRNTSQEFLKDIVQSRKDGIDLIWCTQVEHMIDLSTGQKA